MSASSTLKGNKWSKELKEVNKLGFKEKTDCLINGYLSDVDPFRQCPMDLLILFISYIDGFLELKFDITVRAFMTDIINEGTAIQRDAHPFNIFYGCSRGFSSRYHLFHIKCKTKSKNKKPADCIGILSDINVCKTNGTFTDLIYNHSNITCYWISNIRKNIQFIEKGNNKYVNCSSFIKWGNNDVISILLDCDKWRVEFRINNYIIGKPFNIQQNKKYHVVICSGTNNTAYKLVH